nr:plastocyanin/azurin family copper-binding protein [Nitratireductor luteus]
MGGSFVTALALPNLFARAGAITEITMGGRSDGSHVWFDPVGLMVQPGQTIRWINRDRGNSHTATAYHPANFGKPNRIPAAAEPWDSDYLLPGESFSVTLTQPGVYDYFCIPHERAGMVGRIVVAGPQANDRRSRGTDAGLPEAARLAFPAVEDIVANGMVERK